MRSMNSGGNPNVEISIYNDGTTDRVFVEQAWAATSATVWLGVPLCPDLLRYEQIGAADNWRGRVVRAFFYVMRLWRAG